MVSMRKDDGANAPPAFSLRAVQAPTPIEGIRFLHVKYAISKAVWGFMVADTQSCRRSRVVDDESIPNHTEPPMHTRRVCLFLTLGATALLSGLAHSADSDSCSTIRLADIGWTDNAANNALATVVANGLGYKVQKTTVSAPIAMTGLKGGQLDAFLDYWSPALDATVEPFRSSVSIGDEPNMRGAKYTLAVPQYLYDAGLHDFSDLERFRDKLSGKIYGIEPGSGGNKSVSKMIDQNLFNVGNFKLVESSEAAMLVQVRRAVQAKEPIVFLAWSPHPMNLDVKLQYLSGGDKVFGPDYGAAKVYTAMSKQFVGTCPNAAKLVSQLRFTPDMESAIMAQIMAKKDPTDSAKAYLQNHQELLSPWLSGVTTVDGKEGVPAVKRSLGL